MGKSNVIDWGADRLRISPWRGDPEIAYLAPSPGRPPRAAAIESCVRGLRAQGYRAALTAALGSAEQGPFLEAGFHIYEHLHLLRHDLHAVPNVSAPAGALGHRLRRGRRRDQPTVLQVDGLAFDTFWRFDALGLADARSATPTARFRVADVAGLGVAAYAICGRAGSIGYLQRLAVHPAAQGNGIGAALVVDALRWSRARGASSVMVNTQEENHAALRLYQRLGFQQETAGLAVLELPLDVPAEANDGERTVTPDGAGRQPGRR